MIFIAASTTSLFKDPSFQQIYSTKPDELLPNLRNPLYFQLPTIKDFAIVKPISRGAFGKVFLGYKNNDPNKFYAIKVCTGQS